MKYIPHTKEDIELMLADLGMDSFEDLWKEIPEAVRFRGSLELPEPMSEYELFGHLSSMAGKNLSAASTVSFMGAGAYDHFVPSVVDHILLRGEFYTAYTPYQPEVSQGTLQVIYEYQSMITELTGMDAANASMYDGATALAEAALMAVDVTRKKKVLVAETINPRHLDVVVAYLLGRAELEIVKVPAKDGKVDISSLQELLDDDTAAVMIQQPNFFGQLEDSREIGELLKDKKALYVVSADPISLGVLEAPGNYGADIVLGEGQPMGNPLSFGGPYLGFFAVKDKHVRRMPGRVVGATKDIEGKRGFALTLQTREQHIRREKATSNICSNQALNALAAAVYLSAMGKEGLHDAAKQSLQKAHYLYKELVAIGYEPLYTNPFFKEFVIKTKRPAKEIVKTLANEGILAGVNLDIFSPDWDHYLLIAVTEKRSRDEMDKFVARMGDLR